MNSKTSLRKKVKAALAQAEPRITRTMVARHLNVSLTTVSMALNGVRTTRRYTDLVEKIDELLSKGSRFAADV